ncbi:uncharacterized protein LOC110985034 [Acanthaster planci]|uniref:Uncharacterized protein LOC110985034 n=1 Tax=Acanthaster planci TaxID=133434 RepID=A0A8B7ZDZ4_ACAPL|nr:uncharacterized protein LOC110985034 [Acanthaster planci]
MGRAIITLAVFLAAVVLVSSLKCHVCFNVVGNEASTSCCDNPGASELTFECDPPSRDYVARCNKIDGTLTFPSLGTEFNQQGLVRQCRFFRSNEVPENTCYSGNDALPWLNEDAVSIEFDGEVCFCNATDRCNGAASLKLLGWQLGVLVTATMLWNI